MRTTFDIARNVPCNILDDRIGQVLNLSLDESGYEISKESTVYVSIACVSEEEIQQLNKAYRKKDASTDILSFPVYADRHQIEKEKSGILNIGELVISPDFIDRASQEDKVSFEREFIFVLSHGFLHLLGFDHSPEMFSIQDRVCESLT